MSTPNLSKLQKHTQKLPYTYITREEVLSAQQKWADGVVAISTAYLQGGDYVELSKKIAGELYAFECTDVLFKPTKAKRYPFRSTPTEALSYFIGYESVSEGYSEDKGFAINGGLGYKDCKFENHNIVFHNGIAIAMGTYTFTCYSTNETERLEYTFGYIKCTDDTLKIFLHHSSLPYVPIVAN